ncbi:hypothetical protein KC992_01070 [Candidatus Saccharibacteria bacterium]|nr:hypothetical protein [Candidatus Saccharibacteria bacterium]
MRIDFSNCKTEVTKSGTGTYFVKLHFEDIGFYVSGIRVVPSKKVEGQLLVYKPAILNANDEWKSNYDYAKSCELWLYFKELALKAVDDYDDASEVFEDVEHMDIEAELGKAIDEMEGKSN